jgi:hypothetical protein
LGITEQQQFSTVLLLLTPITNQREQTTKVIRTSKHNRARLSND